MGFTVDPLFHQMSAQFDEGGAKGLLLNTLSVFHGCEIVFDSQEVPEKIMKFQDKVDAECTSVDLSFMKGKSRVLTCEDSVCHRIPIAQF